MFAYVRNTVKHLYLLFVALCLILILAASGMVDRTFLDGATVLPQEYSEAAIHFETSTSPCFEEVYISSYFKNELLKFRVRVKVVPQVIFSLEKDGYISSIWQPPKLV